LSGLIFDIGFHNGSDSAHYLERGFRVVAVEANPLLAQAGRERFAEAIAQGRLVLLNVGIARETGVATFWVNDHNSEWSSFLESAGRRDGTAAHAIEVPTTTFAALIAEYGTPYYAKIDIEGHDWFCLLDLPAVDPPQFISVEAHRLEYLAVLFAHGYRGFKVINQREHGPGFPRGSSGPVSDTIADWEPLETVAYDWSHMRLGKPWRSALRDGWYDFHARLDGPELTDGWAKPPLRFRLAHRARHALSAVARRLRRR
jgi:FkbM family methyltransferase